MSFWFLGKSGGRRHGRSLGFGELSCFPSRTNTHQDFSLHLLDCRTEELQRGQRELPSGQSLQFSLSTLPFGHTAWLPEKETSQHERQCRAGWKPGGGAASVGKETRGPTLLQNYQTVEEVCGKEKNQLPPIVCSIFFIVMWTYH